MHYISIHNVDSSRIHYFPCVIKYRPLLYNRKSLHFCVSSSPFPIHTHQTYELPFPFRSFSSIAISAALIPRRSDINRAFRTSKYHFSCLLLFSTSCFPAPLFCAYLPFLSNTTTMFCPLSTPYPYVTSLHFPHTLPLSFHTSIIIHNFGPVLSTSSSKTLLS